MDRAEYALLLQVRANLKRNIDSLDFLLSNCNTDYADVRIDKNEEKCDVCGLSFILDGKCVNLVCDKNSKEQQ